MTSGPGIPDAVVGVVPQPDVAGPDDEPTSPGRRRGQVAEHGTHAGLMARAGTAFAEPGTA